MATTQERLKAWMERERFSFKQAAGKLRVDVSTLTRWLNGSRSPRGLYAEKVERALRRSEATEEG